MVVNSELKFVFFMNPRTASRATASWLLDNIPGSTEPQCNSHAGLDILLKRGYVPAYPELDDWMFYQTVRHPCDLMTSHYYGNVPKEKYPTLMSWLNAGAPGPELLVSGSLFWRFIVHKTFRFENLADLRFHFWGRYMEKTAFYKDMYHNPRHKTRSRKEIPWQQVWGEPELVWARENLRDLKTYGYVS